MSSPSPTGDTGVEVIDPELHSPTEIAAHVVMNTSDGEQQGIHAHVVQQQRRRRISFSPQSKALKVSGNRHSLSKTVARMVSTYRQSRVLKSQNKNNHAFGINCRCQPRCIVNVVKDFDDRKELIGEIGFDGILDIKLSKVHRQFGAWLLSKVDPNSCTIVKDVDQELPFGLKDVNKVFGLPCTGNLIMPCSQEELDEEKKKIVYQSTVKCGQYYNWSQFVIDEVKKAAELMPSRFPKSSQGSINGCIIFLMAIYLTNLVSRKVKGSSFKSCHISQLEDDQIARMIEEDIVSKQNPGFPFPRYGKLQLRKAQRDDTPNLAEVSPLDVCSASTIPPKGMDGHNNLVQTLLSYYNSLDISQTVGPQAYDELKACLQDEF